MIKFVSDIWQVSDILWVLLYMIKFVSDIWQVSDIHKLYHIKQYPEKITDPPNITDKLYHIK
jgi:hypothetical protein